jgi:hypothetical protein
LNQPLHDRADQSDIDPRWPTWTVKENNRGVIVCRPRYTALEERRDLQWEAREIQQKGADAFAVAQGESWDVPSGTPYLPLFADRVKEVSPWDFRGWYVKDAPDWHGKLLIRCGYDGGLHKPAMVVGQYDPAKGMLWIKREFRPIVWPGILIDMQAHSFVAVCRYLLGMATLEDLKREEMENLWSTAAAIAWIEGERKKPFYNYDVPWISPGGYKFEMCHVMADHEASQMNQLAARREENSLKKIYRAQGINLRGSHEGWDHRELALDFLMREGPISGEPRLWIDSSCKTLLKGMCGGLVAAGPGKRKPYIEKSIFEDPFDAFCNVMCSAFPLAHAGRLRKLDEFQEEQRIAAIANDKTPRGTRWNPPARISNGWGAMRSLYRED